MNGSEKKETGSVVGLDYFLELCTGELSWSLLMNVLGVNVVFNFDGVDRFKVDYMYYV